MMNGMLFAFADTLTLEFNPWLLGVAALLGICLYFWRADRHGHVSRGMVVLGTIAFLAAIVIESLSGTFTWSRLLLSSLSWLGVLGGLGFISFRQPIYAALSFALAVIASCGIFVWCEAPFLAAGTMIVYAGATIIIFLFVLMFAQRSKLQHYDLEMAYPTLNILAGILLLGVLWCAIPNMPMSNPVEATPAKVADLGRVMYTDYLWAVEIAGTLLLVATIGAVIIAMDYSWAEHSPNLREAAKSRPSKGNLPQGGNR